jgi:hypothetical protein
VQRQARLNRDFLLLYMLVARIMPAQTIPVLSTKPTRSQPAHSKYSLQYSGTINSFPRYNIQESDTTMDPNWHDILEKVERGELTPEEGAALMKQEIPAPAPDRIDIQPTDVTPADTLPTSDPDFEARMKYWQRWWIIPLWVGAGIFLFGAMLLAWGSSENLMFWFVCGFFPLLFGLLVMLLAWWSNSAHWVHVRVRSKHEGRNTRVAISMPLPIRLTGWILRIFGPTIPGLRDQPQVIEMLPELFRELDRSRGPIVVEVNDNDDEEVQVYIT